MTEIKMVIHTGPRTHVLRPYFIPGEWLKGGSTPPSELLVEMHLSDHYGYKKQVRRFLFHRYEYNKIQKAVRIAIDNASQ